MANNDTQRAGDFFSLSQISPIADLGRSMQKRAATEAALKNRAPINLGSGVLYDPSTRESSTSKEYQNTLAAKRQHEMDLANAKVQRANDKLIEQRTYKEGRDAIKRDQEIEDRDYKAQQKLKPSAKTSADMAAMQNTVNEGQSMLSELDKNPEAIEQFWDMPSAALRELGADPIANVLESLTKTPEERSVKQRLNSYIATIRHNLSGAALTKMEKTLGNQYLANASGLSQDEARERLRNMIKYLEGELNLNKERYGIEQTDIDRRESDELMDLSDDALDAELSKLQARINE